MRPGPRHLLLATAAAIAAASTAVLLLLGLPLLAAHRLDAERYALVVALAALAGLGVGAVLLVRLVARPIDRLLAAAARIGGGEGSLPPLGEGELTLARAAVAFERVAGALDEERARLAAKVAELTASNRALAEARESLLRSEKLATVGRLAAGLAHEVGNPLGAVAGYAELARKRVPPGADPELGDALERIAAAAARIDRTVRDLLDFARPAVPAILPIDLAPALEAALRLARVQARMKRVEVAQALAPGLPRVLADEHQLAQVFLNLLLNAGDAMGGEGQVRIAARAEGGQVVVELADTGPGIAAEDLPRIFDPFFTTKDPGKGTGLGLAISHRILEALGGEIAACNRPGGGALFTVRLRAAP
ncbi:MAG: two-component sensor histidine kinase [Deltaproteobacteria bacterium]|nr:two-component sensor histidine kinase [Deltaproteobacteria bacterium]